VSAPVAASVVIPTRNRRESLLRVLLRLGDQTCPRDEYEVVVAIDGSTDGSDEAVRALAVPYALRVVNTGGRGRAAACNAGARAAVGRILVLLDDDMEPEEVFVEAHVRLHAPGERLGIVGAVPIRLDGASSPVAVYIGEKFNRHLARLGRAGYRMTFRDFYSGNFSIPRELFLEVGGFDEEFRIYGNEDGELALRLAQAGVDIRYSDEPAARQHYEKDFAALARDNVAKGRTAVLLARKWPQALPELRFARVRMSSRKWRAALWILLAASKAGDFVPGLVTRAMQRIERRRPRDLDRYYRFVLDYFYQLGARSELEKPTSPEEKPKTVAAFRSNDAPNRHPLH
jgi:GT2 family glycosyltransferase